MPITITITGDTASEALGDLQKIATALTSSEQKLPIHEMTAAAKAAGKAPARKPAKVVEPVVDEDDEDEEEEEAPAPKKAAPKKAAAKAAPAKAAKGSSKRSVFDEMDEDDDDSDAEDDEDEAEEEDEDDDRLTHVKVRDAFAPYVNSYGMDAALEDGPKVFKALKLKDVEAISDIDEDDQETLQAVLDGFEELIEKNPFKRKPVAAAKKGKK